MFDVREPSIDALRAAPVKFRYRSNRRKVLIDSFTAGTILAVYEAANEDNRAKLERMVAGTFDQFQRVAKLAFSLVK